MLLSAAPKTFSFKLVLLAALWQECCPLWPYPYSRTRPTRDTFTFHLGLHQKQHELKLGFTALSSCLHRAQAQQLFRDPSAACKGYFGLLACSRSQPTHHATCGAPAHGVGQALLDLAHTLVAGAQHALVPLGVQQLGASIQAHGLTQVRRYAKKLNSATRHLHNNLLYDKCKSIRKYLCKHLHTYLCVGSGGVSDVGAGGLAVLAQALHDLGGVAVEVVAHISEGDLTAVQNQGHSHQAVGLRLRVVITAIQQACAGILMHSKGWSYSTAAEAAAGAARPCSKEQHFDARQGSCSKETQ
eukprot:1148766-Pelagomonas_calceolata.AAC.3